MYSASDLFRKAYSYALKHYNLVAILSAKYGLLFPDDVIEPYDLTLNNMSLEEVKKWSDRVFTQMNSRLNLREYKKVFFHAGKRYRQFLIPKLRKIDVTCEAPLKDLIIGKQKAWYKQHDP